MVKISSRYREVLFNLCMRSNRFDFLSIFLYYFRPYIIIPLSKIPYKFAEVYFNYFLNYMIFPLVCIPLLLRQCIRIALFAVAERWLLLGIGWFVCQLMCENLLVRGKGRDLIQSYDKSPYTNKQIQKASWHHKKHHQIFDYTTIADRVMTVSWGNDSHQTGVVISVNGIFTLPLTTAGMQPTIRTCSYFIMLSDISIWIVSKENYIEKGLLSAVTALLGRIALIFNLNIINIVVSDYTAVMVPT